MVKLIPIPKKLRRILKIHVWIILSIIILFITISFLILIPSIQNFITTKATKVISERTKMPIDIGSIHITFPKTIKIENISIIDSTNNPLFICDQIKINVELFPLIMHKVKLDKLHINGANITFYKNQADSLFNFSPLLNSTEKKVQKKSKESSWEIDFDELELNNIKVNFNNQISSSEISLYIGNFLIVVNSIDINSGNFNIDKIDIENTSMSMLSPPKKKPKKTGASPNDLPFNIKLKDLNLKNIHFDLKSGDEKLQLNADLKQASIKPKLLNFGLSELLLNELILDGVTVDLKTAKKDSSYRAAKQKLSSDQLAFGNFPWKISLNSTEITNTSFNLESQSKLEEKPSSGKFPVSFQDISLFATDLYFNNNSAKTNISNLQTTHASGLILNELEGQYSIDNKTIKAIDMSLSTSKSSIQGFTTLTYTSLKNIGKSIEKLEFNSNLEGNIQIDEIASFTSILDQYPDLLSLDQIKINEFKFNGAFEDLSLENLNIGIGDSTVLEANGSVKNLPSKDLKIFLNIDTIITTAVEMKKFLPDSLIPSQILLPKTISLGATFQYSTDSIDFKTNIETSSGDVSFDVQLLSNNVISNMQVKELDIGQILNDTIFGKLILASEFKGKIHDKKINFFSTEIDIQSFDFYRHSYNDIQLLVERNKNHFSLSSSINDSLLSLVAVGDAIFKDSSNHYNLDVKINNADLKGIKLLSEDLKIAGNLKVNTDFISTNNISGIFLLSNINLKNSLGEYYIKELKIIPDIKKHYTNFNLTSDILDASLTGNTKIADLKTTFYNHINNYISIPDSLLNEKDYQFNFDLSLYKPEFFTDFLFEKLDEIKIDTCHASYDRVQSKFDVDIRIPKLIYDNWELDGLSLLLNSDEESVHSEINLNQFSSDSAFIKNILIATKFKNQESNFLFNIKDDNNTVKYSIEADIAYKDSSYIAKLIPEKLILNQKHWFVDPNNQVIFNKNKELSVQSAIISNEKQMINLELINNHLKLNFKEFDVQNITNIVEYKDDSITLKGNLNGFIDAYNLQEEPTVKSKIDINNLTFKEEYLGNFKSKVNIKPNEKSNFSLNLRNDKNSIFLDGDITHNNGKNNLKAKLETDISKAEVFSDLVSEYILGLNGEIKGDLEINGEIRRPQINGQLKFEDLSMTLKSWDTFLNTNGTISVKDNQIGFKNLFISDSLENQFSIKGNIDIRNFTNPEFNLKLKTTDFLLINNEDEKDESIQGKLLVGLDILTSGSLSNLIVKSDVTINENTDIMYVVPGKSLELITDDGIVEFSSFNNLKDTIIASVRRQFIADSVISKFEGIDLNVNLKINPKAQFSINLNPNSGDITSFKLNGNLEYKHNNSQKGNLNGILELEEGYYQLSYYGLIKKRFEYDPGSSINWSGNVMDGDLNFSARNMVRTNSIGLVSGEISSAEKSMYNQQLPYEVVLKINDRISYPTISFGIDLPDRYKNDNQTIATKINMLNQAGMESELNKQVFALLVGGTFIPENPDIYDESSGSNFATTAAINSVNSIMTQQLNKLTGQFIKNFDVDMGVNTFDDYTSGQANMMTQLDVRISKKMFNNRLSAEFVSHIDLEGTNNTPQEQSTDGMSEFTVNYQITKSPNYGIKIFRENGYDLFDGEIQNSGIGFIFIKDFDHFKKKPSPIIEQSETDSIKSVLNNENEDYQ
jgi:translocation and assembly module TamB